MFAIVARRKPDTTFPVRPIKCGGIIFTSEIEKELLLRIKNWERAFRTRMILHAVPYYQPPILGEIFQDELLCSTPIQLQDAIIVEYAWRSIDDPCIKLFIKQLYIQHMKHEIIWRRLRKQGVKIRCMNEHEKFRRRSLEQLSNNLYT